MISFLNSAEFIQCKSGDETVCIMRMYYSPHQRREGLGFPKDFPRAEPEENPEENPDLPDSDGVSSILRLIRGYSLGFLL